MSLVGKGLGITLADLEKITDNFSDQFRVGTGRYGSVYRGVYDGQEIAVMKLHPVQELDDMAFDFEFHNLTKVNHPNVVRLIGYSCESRTKCFPQNGELVFAQEMVRVLCFEYMQGGSLDKHIKDESCDIDWPTCYKIIRGACEALNHLHNSHERPIFHLDLKPANILLDKNLTAKIGDLGLSRLLASLETDETEILRGTLGYMPPEYIKSGHISKKFDVFSLGVIILKIMAGNKGYSRCYELPPEQFAELVINNWVERLQSRSGHSPQKIDILRAKACVDIALKCVHADSHRRPSVKDIVDELEELESTIHMENIHMEFDSLESVLGGSKSPRHLKLSFLKFITKQFSDELKIGSGGCGVVYKGIVRNQIIAVKRLLNSHTIEDKMFHREVKSMMMVNHKNVVRFLGYCSHTEEQALKINGKFIMAQNREKLLCFEYLINGSLESYITDELRGLEWQTRYQIVKGICDGLHHLHSENHIVHMDLKPANILLDSNMVPKIIDFGLSRLDNISQTMSSERLVSLGYCAPEYLDHGKMSPKSDIYSLGVIILVLVTGSKEEPNITKVHRRWKHRWNKSAMDTQLGYKQVAMCLDLVRRCIHKDPKQRPNIRDIINYLNKMDCSDAKISDGTECLELEEDMLGVEPLEIHLPFELNKQISCSVELINDTDDHFAFRISTTSLRPYCIEANEGTVPPRSKCSVNISLQALHKALPGHECMDEFSVQSTRVDGCLAATNIGADIFNEELGKVIDTVNFSVVLIEASSTMGKPQMPAYDNNVFDKDFGRRSSDPEEKDRQEGFEKEREMKLREEMKLEKERELEQQRERERVRQAVERATKEARERAAAEARAKAETEARQRERERVRQAVERATKEARERAAAEARAKAETEARQRERERERQAVVRAAKEAWERAAAEACAKAKRETRQRERERERQVMERATKEACERAIAEAGAKAEREARWRASVQMAQQEAHARAAVEFKERAAQARERVAAEAKERAAAEAKKREQAAAERASAENGMLQGVVVKHTDSILQAEERDES